MSRYIEFLVDFFRLAMDAMNGEVHTFQVIGSALDGNPFALLAGERCNIILFMRQKKGTDDDWRLAKKMMSEEGWGDIEIIDSGRTTRKNLKGMDAEFADCYENALVNGCALLVYQDIED
ncbi:MAG: hypothetical protein AB2660_14070 [Candidatus Thiodiazotropha sp.]